MNTNKISCSDQLTHLFSSRHQEHVETIRQQLHFLFSHDELWADLHTQLMSQ